MRNFISSMIGACIGAILGIELYTLGYDLIMNNGRGVRSAIEEGIKKGERKEIKEPAEKVKMGFHAA